MPRAQGGGTGGSKGVGAPGESDGGGVDMDGGLITDTDEEEPSEEEKDRERRIKAGWDKDTQDNLKWPAGEGWKPLQQRLHVQVRVRCARFRFLISDFNCQLGLVAFTFSEDSKDLYYIRP